VAFKLDGEATQTDGKRFTLFVVYFGKMKTPVRKEIFITLGKVVTLPFDKRMRDSGIRG
jgi:hypothetical protein